jgi:hypothetical protein
LVLGNNPEVKIVNPKRLLDEACRDAFSRRVIIQMFRTNASASLDERYRIVGKRLSVSKDEVRACYEAVGSAIINRISELSPEEGE